MVQPLPISKAQASNVGVMKGRLEARIQLPSLYRLRTLRPPLQMAHRMSKWTITEYGPYPFISKQHLTTRLYAFLSYLILSYHLSHVKKASEVREALIGERQRLSLKLTPQEVQDQKFKELEMTKEEFYRIRDELMMKRKEWRHIKQTNDEFNLICFTWQAAHNMFENCAEDANMAILANMPILEIM